MADAPKKPASKGKGISKRLGPLPYWGWGLVGVGAFLAYRYIKARELAGAATAASGTTGGGLIPNDIGLPPASTAPGAGTFSSVSSWEQAALSFLTGNGLSPADALNGVTSWLNGNCVSQAAYNGISSALVSSSVGLPPGYTNLPTLSVCPAPQQNPGPTNPSPAPAAPTPALPLLNSQEFQKIFQYGQYAPGQFTQVGFVGPDHKYAGSNVLGNAPVYAGVLGGFVQDFDWATIPVGTAIYVPTDLVQQGYSTPYVQPS